MTLEELRALLAQIVSDMEALLDAADSEERDLTADEETRYTELEAKMDQAEADIKKREADDARRARLESKKGELKKPVTQPPRMAATYRAENDEDIENVAHLLYLARWYPNDARIEELRAQSMGVGAEGGIMVPTELSGTMLSLTPQEAIFRPRANVIPAGTPPDAELTIPALDQTSAENIYGGAAVEWISEGKAKPETDIRLKEISLTPQEVAAHVVVTDKLLRNWTAASSVIESQLRLAVIGAEETAFYNGDGVGKPQGVLQSAARIDYARATASQIGFADVTGMYARLRMSMAPVWIASQTCIPQLVNIRDTGNNNLWVQSVAADLPPSLWGFPIYFHERSVALGTAGDLVLADLSYYLIKDGSGPFVAASEHVHFTSNKTVIKIFWNVDGQPWLTEPIGLEGSTTNTVSPFVVLD